jgi:hypothetical protein
MQILKPLVVYRTDSRHVTLSPYGLGNLKLGPGVFTYSRLPGRPSKASLGLPSGSRAVEDLAPDGAADSKEGSHRGFNGTCPGSTPECERICYAERPVAEMNTVASMWLENSMTDDVAPIPEEAKLLRLHVSGDFNTVVYIENWIKRLTERPDVTCWVYTRSWRVPELLPALERLRAMPNVQMFASMDASCPDVPPEGWRRSWIHRSYDQSIQSGLPMEDRLHPHMLSLGVDVEGRSILRTSDRNMIVWESDDPLTSAYTPAFVCPEETGDKQNCVECRYCFDGKKHDVVFLEH